MATAPWQQMETESLEVQPWSVMSAGGKVCLVKGVFDEEGYEVAVWDMCLAWTEKLEKDEITGRMTRLNPKIEAPLTLILNHLSSLISKQSSTSTYDINSDPSAKGMTLLINSTLSSLPFTWEFTCTPASDDVLTRHLVTPLLSVTKALCHQNSQLISHLKRKDNEIQDYKDHGAKVSRRHLETETFDEKKFNDEQFLSQEFEASALLPLDTVNNNLFRDLYRNVNMVQLWDSKTTLPTATDATCNYAAGGGGACADKISSSLRSPSSSLRSPSLRSPSSSSPTTSPIKRPLVISPSKEDEKSRRESLERKLEEERAQGKKKRKRLI